MKLIKTFENFTSLKDTKDIKIDTLKNELNSEKSKVRKMKSVLDSVYTNILKYKDFKKSTF